MTPSEREAMVRKAAGALCCGVPCAAKDDGSEFTVCQISSYMRDAKVAIAAIEPLIRSDEARKCATAVEDELWKLVEEHAWAMPASSAQRLRAAIEPRHAAPDTKDGE